MSAAGRTDGAAPLVSGRYVLVIPCLDHHEQLGTVVRDAQRMLPAHEIVVVDDGSAPPVSAVGAPGAHVLRHEQNVGLSRALQSGFRHAIAIGADGVIKLDADGQMDVDALPRFVEALDRGHDVVLGTFDPARTPRDERAADTLFRLLFRLGTGRHAPTVLAEYRGYSAAALDILVRESPSPWASPLTLFSLHSLRWCVVPRCVCFVDERAFPAAGMWQLRVMFLRYLWREGSVRALATMPVAAVVLFAHMAAHLGARAVRGAGAGVTRQHARSASRTSRR